MSAAPSGSGRPVKALLAAMAFQIYNSCVTRVPFHSLRRWYLTRILGVEMGRGSVVHMNCFVTGRRIVIGDHSVVNRGCYLDGRAGLRLGRNVSVSPECMLLSLTHDVNDPDFRGVPKPVDIGDYAWLGARALILPGVEMGRGAVAGAGAVVARSCGEFEIVAGSPARKIGDRNRDLRYTLDYFPWFNTDITG